MSRIRRRIYYAIKNCSEALEKLRTNGCEAEIFHALFFCHEREVNSLENASTLYFDSLMREYDKTEEPDEVIVEFYDKGGVLVWCKKFLLSDRKNFNNLEKNLSEVEVIEIINRKIAGKEIELLHIELKKLKRENEILKRKLNQKK